MIDCEAFEAEGGVTALEIVAAHGAPDLILMDLTLPHGTASEFITNLRLTPGNEKIKIVLLSGRDDLQEQAKELGAVGALKKPSSLSAIENEIQRCLKLKEN